MANEKEKRYKVTYGIYYHYKRAHEIIFIEFSTFAEFVRETSKYSNFVADRISKDTGIPREKIANFSTYIALYDDDAHWFTPLASVALSNPEEFID